MTSKLEHEVGILRAENLKLRNEVARLSQQTQHSQPADTDKLSVEKLQEELESCIQTLIEASAAATITQDIVVGNLVDRKLSKLAKTHENVTKYIEKVTGKNIDVVLAENAALEAEEEE